MLGTASGLPNTLVRLTPVVDHEVDEPAAIIPVLRLEVTYELAIQVRGVQQFTVNVQLQLAVCGISDAYGLGATVAFEFLQAYLCEPPLATHAVHHLQVPRAPDRSSTPASP